MTGDGTDSFVTGTRRMGEVNQRTGMRRVLFVGIEVIIVFLSGLLLSSALMFQHGARGHLLGAFAVAARLLRAFDNVLVHPLLFLPYPTHMLFAWHF
jgi:hypothetical protein